MDIFSIISLLGGLALFLYGMQVMGDELKKNSSGMLKNALNKVTNNLFSCFLFGLAVTAVVQSSTATIVLVAGLVGAGVLSLKQAGGFILGANVGTTATGQIIRLLDIDGSGSMLLALFRPSTLAPLATVIGIICIMFVNRSKAKSVGQITMGFGILFTGLMSMTAAFAPLSESPEFLRMLAAFSDVPILGFLLGGLLSLVIHSSAAVGVVQTLSVTGGLTFSSVYPIIIGINIGDCLAIGLLCFLMANADSKRVGAVYIIFNICSALVVLIGVNAAHHFGWLNGLWNMTMTSGTIANVHSLFRLTCALLFLPLIYQLIRLSYHIIHEKVKSLGIADKFVPMLSEKVFKFPAIALATANESLVAMSEMAKSNVNTVFAQYFEYNEKELEEMNMLEDDIDRITDAAENYLVELSAKINLPGDSDMLNLYLQCLTEYERIGDYAINLAENVTELRDKGITFSLSAQDDLHIIFSAIREIVDLTNDAFAKTDYVLAQKVEPLEEVVDELVAELKNRHIERLRIGKCNVYSGLSFLNVLTYVERIADHCSNIALYVMALEDKKLLQKQHDYIRDLHKGDDPGYIHEYHEQREKYLDHLSKIKED